MPTIVDSLVLLLNLDPSGFKKGQAEATASMAKTREAAVKHGAGIEKSMDGAAEAVDRLARNALKLFAVFTAGRAIGAFTADITAADAALGRLAKSVGSTPDVISSLGNAVARNGGSATAAAGSFERLADSINEIKTTGNSSILPFLYRLQGLGGKQINLNKEMSETFGDLAENAKNIADKQGVPFATYLLKQAGVDRDTAALLVKGREAYNKALAESRRIGIVRKEDTEAAQKLETVMESLRQTSEGFGRTILTAVTPIVTDLIERMREWITANQDWIKTEIVAKIREFAEWLKSIDWNAVGAGIRGFIKGADDAAKSIGGWKVAAEAFFALWAASRIAALFAPIMLQIGGIRLALLGLGPVGWSLLGLGALGGVLASADPSKSIVHGGVPGGASNPGDLLPGVDSSENRPQRMGIFARTRRAVVNRMRRQGGGEGGVRDGDVSGFRGKASPGNWWTPDRQQHAIDRLKAGGVSELGARALVARWSAVEAPGGPASVNPKSGAFGIGQWLGSRKPAIAGNTNFDDQIDHALKELNGSEGKALTQLNSAKNNAQAAIGASMFERAENYNPRTGLDDWTGKTASAMDRLVGANNAGPASAKTAASADGAPDPTDGKGVNGDLMKVIKRAQELSAVKFHVHEGLRTVERQAEMVRRGWSKTMASKHLTGRAVDLRADGDPAVGDLDAAKYAKINEAISKASKEMGVPVEWGGNWKGFKDTPHFQLPDDYKSKAEPYPGDKAASDPKVAAEPKQTPQKTSALDAQREGARAAIAQTQAAQAAMVSNTSNDNRNSYSSENHIGAINVHTAATDASGIARDIGPAIKRHAFAAAANYARA